MNDMLVNPDNLQAMIMGCDKKENKYDLNTKGLIVSSLDFASFIGIEIGSKFNFEKHISTIFKKASRQLNAISRIQSHISKKRERNYYQHFCMLSLHVLPASMACLF